MLMHITTCRPTERNCCPSGAQSWLPWSIVTPALQQLHWLPVEYRIKYKLCALMHQIHTGRAPPYLVDSVQSVAESSRRRPAVWGPPTLPTTSNAALVRSSVNVASVILVQLRGTIYLPVPALTPSDFFKLLKSHLPLAFWYFVCVPGQSTSRVRWANSYWLATTIRRELEVELYECLLLLLLFLLFNIVVIILRRLFLSDALVAKINGKT